MKRAATTEKRVHPEKFDDQDSINKSVARILKDYRAKNLLSQREAGLEFKTNQSNIAQYELETRDSPVSFQIRLAVASRTPIVEINPEIAKLIEVVSILGKRSKSIKAKSEAAELRKKNKNHPIVKAIDAVDEKLDEIKTKASRPKTPGKKKTQTPLAKAKVAR